MNRDFARWICLALLLACTTWAQALEVYVNNRPFKGLVKGSAANLMLELTVLQKMVHIELEYDADEGVLWVEGDEVPVQVVNSKPLVEVKRITELIPDGKYTVNQQLGSVDIYLLAPKRKGSGSSVAGTTYLKIKKNGKQWSLKPPEANFKIRWAYSRSPDLGVRVTVDTGERRDRWDLTFAGPGRTQLQLGTYKGAERMPSKESGRAGVDIYGPGGSTSGAVGELKVLEFEYNDKGPKRFAIDFLLKGYNTKMRGQLRFNSMVP